MWTYKGKEITSIDQVPKDAFGFVYQITHLPTGQMYIGRKNFVSKTNRKITKKELSEHTGKGRKPSKVKVVKESNWLDYRGSSKEFLELTKGCLDSNLKKEIMCFCPNSKSLSYQEVKHQFLLGVLENIQFVNSNIGGKFYRKDTEILS